MHRIPQYALIPVLDVDELLQSKQCKLAALIRRTVGKDDMFAYARECDDGALLVRCCEQHRHKRLQWQERTQHVRLPYRPPHICVLLKYRPKCSIAPALMIRMSKCPKAFCTSFAALLTLSAIVTSTETATTLGAPRFAEEAACPSSVTSDERSDQAATAMPEAPALAYDSAVARPMTLLASATKTCLPARSCFIGSMKRQVS